jgi:hypothetical protein
MDELINVRERSPQTDDPEMLSAQALKHHPADQQTSRICACYFPTCPRAPVPWHPDGIETSHLARGPEHPFDAKV